MPSLHPLGATLANAWPAQFCVVPGQDAQPEPELTRFDLPCSEFGRLGPRDSHSIRSSCVSRYFYLCVRACLCLCVSGGACPCIITVYMCSCTFAIHDLYQPSSRTGELSPKLPLPSCQVSARGEEREEKEEGGRLGSFFPGIKATWGTVRLLVIGSHPLSAIAMLRRCLECHTTHRASLTPRKQSGVVCGVVSTCVLLLAHTSPLRITTRPS